MSATQKNIKKIINDPVYGFINIESGIIYDIIEHPFFQRLRRIKQLGLTYLIYPGATHTRFQHSLGTLHLMDSAIEVLRSKGHTITDEEETGVKLAILLHDIGHAPFSHSLEGTFIKGVSHEDLTLLLMDTLNKEFDGALNLAIKIYKNNYEKRFLHQLVASQLDVDRLDYLRRDSFFSGVYEGTIGTERIIKMMNVHNDELVIDSKGIYSVEKFLIARRLMYWQVYFHKTALSAEQLLLKIIERAKYLKSTGHEINAPQNIHFFLSHNIKREDMLSNNNDDEHKQKILHYFSLLDDDEIMTAIKNWRENTDNVLAILSDKLINRKLFKIHVQDAPFDETYIYKMRRAVASYYNLNNTEASNFVFTDCITNNAYSIKDDKINILYKNREIIDIAYASDMSNVSALAKTVKKYFLCYPEIY